MRDGYSDDGVKWDNVKLFLKTEEKPLTGLAEVIVGRGH